MKNKILLVAIGMALGCIAVSSEASTNPFVPNGSVTINSMPQSENPIWTPPLASPSVTSSGILSAFYTSNMSQANPNSPQPSVAACPTGYSGSNGTYQWSGSDNTGWVITGDTGCVAPPPASAPAPTQTIIPTVFCRIPIGDICSLNYLSNWTWYNGVAYCLNFNTSIATSNNGAQIKCGNASQF